jgi:hypothetical protein
LKRRIDEIKEIKQLIAKNRRKKKQIAKRELVSLLLESLE